MCYELVSKYGRADVGPWGWSPGVVSLHSSKSLDFRAPSPNPFTMAKDTPTYEQQVWKACEALGPKFLSRQQIKTFLKENFSYNDSAMAKLHLKKALAKFERKGDSYRITKEMRTKAGASAKTAAAKAKASEKTAALKEKNATKKAAGVAKKAALKEKNAAKKKASAEKKAATKAKALEKKASMKAKKAAKKTKAPKKKAVKKPKAVKKTKVTKKTTAKK
jgi:hypothetical protein